MNSCPHCGGIPYLDNDGYENLIVCSACAREYNPQMIPLRMQPQQFSSFYGLKLSTGTKDDIMDIR